MTPPTILLGYEVGSGREVRIPVRHMAVVGLTQRAGKTTALDGLFGRSGLRAVTFITKRGEGAFGGHSTARRIPAFLQPGCDWQSVTALLEAHLGEKLGIGLRPHIMRACSGLPPDESANKKNQVMQPLPANTLQEVANNLTQMESDADNKADMRAAFTLAQYFRTLLPELAKCPTSSDLDLAPGLNLMDLSGYSAALQGLVIGSTLEWINARERDIIVLIPEAQEYIPREGSTPCKDVIIRLAKQGGCLNNFLWLDTQELASVAVEARKQVSVYLFGVQREINEVTRTLALIPADRRKPTRANIMDLGRGEFWAVFDDTMTCCYVQPPWLDGDPERARNYAQGRWVAHTPACPRRCPCAYHAGRGKGYFESYPETYVAPRSRALTVASPRRSKSKTAAPPAMSAAAPISGRVQ